MKVIILAGGKGTRLAPYTITFPKPLVPIGDMPIVEVMLRQLKRAGAMDVTVSVGHLAELLMAFLGDGQKLGLKIGYVREDEPLGTVGPLCLVENLPDTFLLMNGDVLTDLDYRQLYEGHAKSGALVSISTFKKKVNVDLGVLLSNADGRVTEYVEKPTYEYDVSMGVYVLSREVLKYIPRGQYFDFPMLIQALLERGEFVRSVPFGGTWLDIGRPSDYEAAQRTFEALRAQILPD
jgi:NDP-sugar pyrophosphorylase family protein